MTDSTTDGYAATPDDIDGMVRNLCAYALGEPDDLQRYVDLTHQQVLFDGMVAAIRLRRGRALADLIVAGTPIDEVATKTKLTAAQVRRLISAAGETERVKEATARQKPPRRRKTAKASAAPPAAEPKPVTEPVKVTELPVGAPASRRLLTADERVALGLPATGPIPRTVPRPRQPADV